MIAPPQSLVALAQPWADFYSDSHLTQTLVTFAHIGGLLVGGGIAIAADRGTLRAASDVDRKRHLLDVSHAHRAVITSLAIVVISGLLLFASDVEAHWGSWIFWVKMAMVALLVANGARMRSIEQRASTDAVVSQTAWGSFRGTAIVSLALWLATTLAGVALLSYA